jgi:hypothetical protein
MERMTKAIVIAILKSMPRETLNAAIRGSDISAERDDGG